MKSVSLALAFVALILSGCHSAHHLEEGSSSADVHVVQNPSGDPCTDTGHVRVIPRRCFENGSSAIIDVFDNVAQKEVDLWGSILTIQKDQPLADAAPTPEPSSFILMASALAALALFGRKRGSASLR